jgi:myo-inositol-1(or 4)-monophosphatase
MAINSTGDDVTMVKTAREEFKQTLTDPDVSFAIEVALGAGLVLSKRPNELIFETKSSDTDVVTHMDQLAEELIVAAISSGRPDDGLLGEEGAAKPSTSGRQWVIDPIDGTINYLYKLPHWCVSIGLVEEESRQGIVGVVYAPSLETLFVGAAGKGSYRITFSQSSDLNIHDENTIKTVDRLSVSTEQRLSHSLVGTGFGYTSARRAHQANVLTSILPNVRDIRRLGSCALDLCLVAAGDLDAYFERGVKPWDHSAGSLIVQEAGGIVSGLRGQQANESMILASNSLVAQEFVSILESLDADKGE